MNPFGQAPTLPGHRDLTVTAPALPAGVVAVIVVLLTTTTLVAAVPPNFTVAPEAKFVPVIVTAVPPAVDPLFGLTLLTVGTGPETAKNVAICMTQGPDAVNVAVAHVAARRRHDLVFRQIAIRRRNDARRKPAPGRTIPRGYRVRPKDQLIGDWSSSLPRCSPIALLPLAPAVTSRVVTP